jgi:hypothetical protein
MNRCSHCQKRKEYLIRFEYCELTLCRDCFKRLIETRIKKNIKTFGPLNKGDTLYLKGLNLSKKIAYHVLLKIFDARFINIKKTTPKNPNDLNVPNINGKIDISSKFNKRQIICITDSLEETSHKIVESIFKDSKIVPASKIDASDCAWKTQKFTKSIFLFCDIPYEELLSYSEFEGLRYDKKQINEFKSKINSTIEKSIMFKSLNPSKKELFGLISSFRKLNTLLKEKESKKVKKAKS